MPARGAGGGVSSAEREGWEEVGRRGAGEWMLGALGIWVKARALQTCWLMSWVVGGAKDGRPVNPAQWARVSE